MKKDTKKILFASLLSGIALSTTIMVPPLLSNYVNNSDSVNNNPDKPDIPSITDNLYPDAPWNGELFKSDDMYKIPDDQNTNEYFESANGYLEKIVETNIDRNINNNIYQTKLLTEWQTNQLFNSRNNNGYPAYDLNWRIVQKFGSQYAQDFVQKYYDQVNNETAESEYWDGEPVQWKDFNFIRNEIKHNNLKKHPSADLMHDPNLFIKDTTKAIAKEFMYSGNRNSVYNTGMYAAPGEIITLELTPEEFELWKSNNYKGINILINYQSFDEPRGYGDSGMTADKFPYTRIVFNFDNLKYGNPSSEITDTSDWIFEDGVYKYQFGSPFGGSIAIQYESSLKINGSITPINFKISGGIEEVHYIQGITTESDWYNQLDRVKQGEITSPNIAIDSYWFNAVCNMYNKYQFAMSDAGTPSHFKKAPQDHIVTTNDIVIGGYGVYFSTSSEKSLDELIYPYDMVKKWDNFLMLSNFFIKGDRTNAPYKENMRFGLEVWSDAAGWGGSYNFWTYPETFTQMFFSGEDSLCATGNWLAMHEINHGYEPKNWNFHNLPHGVTNQLTALNLTVIGDVPRYRNIFNINGEWGNGWSRLITPYANVSSNTLDAYTIFTDYLYTAGTGKTFEYVRWQQDNAGKNGYPKYGGIYEIYVMSRFANQNFYYALRDLYAGQNFLPISKDGSNLSELESELINELSKLPSIDIVGNLYASGQYLYDYLTQDYIYTNDVVPAFEIPAGIESYTFNFGEAIKSRNPNFEWEIKNFNETTKYGGTLKVDPANPKNLIYFPPKFNDIDDFSQIDEFDLEITATHTEKYPNYVPGYKFKIKIRQNVTSSNINLNGVDYVVEKQKFVENKDNQILTAKFIAPKTGTYNFNFGNKNKLKLFKNGVLINNNITLISGEIIDVEYSFNKNERSFNVIYENDNVSEEINFFENVCSPYIDNTMLQPNIFNNNEIKYKPRFASTNGLGTWAINYMKQPYEDNVWKSVDPKKYNITYTHGGSKPADANKLKYKDNNPFRIQYVNSIRTVEFQYTFDEPTSISSMVIYSGANGYYSWKPKGLNITCHTKSGDVINLTNNEFLQFSTGFQNVPYESAYKYLNFEETINDITYMEIIVEKETRDNCLDIEWINFLSNKIDSEISNCIPSNSSFINYSSDWSTKNNSFDKNENFSVFNNQSLYTDKTGSYLEFNIYGNGFTLTGKKPNVPTLIDVYIDNNLIITDYDIAGDDVEFNQILYCWFANESSNKNYNIKIVLKNDAPLYINAIGISSLFDTIGRINKI